MTAVAEHYPYFITYFMLVTPQSKWILYFHFQGKFFSCHYRPECILKPVLLMDSGDGVERIQKMGLEIMALDNLGRRHPENEVIAK